MTRGQELRLKLFMANLVIVVLSVVLAGSLLLWGLRISGLL